MGCYNTRVKTNRRVFLVGMMGAGKTTVGRQLARSSPALTRASREVVAAKKVYRDCLAKYGTARWVADEPIRDLMETDLPRWMREDVEVA